MVVDRLRVERRERSRVPSAPARAVDRPSRTGTAAVDGLCAALYVTQTS